jgi:hypothetical protein
VRPATMASCWAACRRLSRCPSTESRCRDFEHLLRGHVIPRGENRRGLAQQASR